MRNAKRSVHLQNSATLVESSRSSVTIYSCKVCSSFFVFGLANRTGLNDPNSTTDSCILDWDGETDTYYCSDCAAAEPEGEGPTFGAIYEVLKHEVGWGSDEWWELPEWLQAVKVEELGRFDLGELETVQRMQFRMMTSYDETSFYRPNSSKFSPYETTNFLNVAQTAGLAVEAWMRSNNKEWDEHLNFESVIDNIGMDVVVAYGERLLEDTSDPDGHAPRSFEVRGLVDKSMVQELRHSNTKA